MARAEGLDRVAASLDVARRAAGQRRLWLALEELQEAWTYEVARRWTSVHASIKSPEQFSAEWRTNEPAALAATSRRIPAIVEAIAASNAIRAPATWRASLPYSQDAGMDAGLYYLGEARAFVEFAAFCRSLPFDPPPASPAFASIAADITSQSGTPQRPRRRARSSSGSTSGSRSHGPSTSTATTAQRCISTSWPPTATR